jgi:hypothetical protein
VKQQLLIFVLLALLSFNSVQGQSNPCYGTIRGRVPDPDYCYRYFQCYFGLPSPQTCGNDKIFDKESTTCIPGNQETCEPYNGNSTTLGTTPFYNETTTSTTNWTNTSTVFTPTWPVSTPTPTPTPSLNTTITQGSTTTTTPRTTTPGPQIPQICANVFFGARPHPTSNVLYIGCIRGNGMIFQCFDKEEFDPRINECVEICEVEDNICVGKVLPKAIVNPCVCSQFIICFQEKIFGIEDCQEGLIFDETEQM